MGAEEEGGHGGQGGQCADEEDDRADPDEPVTCARRSSAHPARVVAGAGETPRGRPRVAQAPFLDTVRMTRLDEGYFTWGGFCQQGSTTTG